MDFQNLEPNDNDNYNGLRANQGQSPIRRTFDSEDPMDLSRRKMSLLNNMNVPMALQIDDQLKNLPEPQRTDY